MAKNNLKNTASGKKIGFPIPVSSYKMILIGFGIIILGFVLMMGEVPTIRLSSIMIFLVFAGSRWLPLLCWPVLDLFFGQLCGNRRKRWRNNL